MKSLQLLLQAFKYKWDGIRARNQHGASISHFTKTSVKSISLKSNVVCCLSMNCWNSGKNKNNREKKKGHQIKCATNQTCLKWTVLYMWYFDLDSASRQTYHREECHVLRQNTEQLSRRRAGKTNLELNYQQLFWWSINHLSHSSCTKCQIFSGSNFSNVIICWFYYSSMIVNWLRNFGPVVEEIRI